MGHKKLWDAVDRVESNGLQMYREHHSPGRTHIKIMWWTDECIDTLFDEWFTTGSSDAQADAMNAVCDQFNNFK